MKSSNAFRMGLTVAIWAMALPAQQQQPAVQANPAPGCTATPAQLDANKKVAMEFLRAAGEARVALADSSYKQHNPAFKKRAEDNKVSDYEEFKNTFVAQAAGRGGKKGGPATGPAPPPGNPFEVVTAECDIVTIIHKNNSPGPYDGARQVLRGLHVRHFPSAQRQTRRALGWRRDQPAWRAGAIEAITQA